MLFRAWNKARISVGVEYLHFHGLHHTGNTLAASTGASTKELISRMGHSSSVAAIRYRHAYLDIDKVIASKLNTIASNFITEST